MTLKKLDTLAVIVSIAVLFLVILMRYVKFDQDINLSFLPAFHAILNTITSFLLIYALIKIKQKNIVAHQNAIYAAIFCSVIFLLSYVVYHFMTPATRYGGEGFLKVLYLLILITHIIFAAISFPLILFTFNRAFLKNFEQHKKFAKFVYPIWLYVAITGPICYLMLRPYYK